MDKLSILTFMLMPGISRGSVYKIWKQFPVINNVNEIFEALHAVKLPAIKPPEKDFVQSKYEEAFDIITQTEASGIQCIPFTDEAFPDSFREIPDPPALFFIEGNIDLLYHHSSMAVIGTRIPTPYLDEVGEKIIRKLKKEGFSIVSGLAIGCDTLAHAFALRNRAKTVAILPSGLRNVYPRVNRRLAERILSERGLLLSEYLPDARADKYQFIERDRLQSALADGVLILETDLQSGTMHTAKFAEVFGKRLACLISHPEKYWRHIQLEGNLQLIREKKAFAINSSTALQEFIHRVKTDIEEKRMEENLKRAF